MSRFFLSPEERARIVRVCRENPDVSIADMAARFGLTVRGLTAIRREAGVSARVLSQTPEARYQRRRKARR